MVVRWWHKPQSGEIVDTGRRGEVEGRNDLRHRSRRTLEKISLCLSLEATLCAAQQMLDADCFELDI